VDHIAGISNYVPILANYSYGTSSPDCSGQNTNARAANELFESGTLLFAAAGNYGHSGSTCTVVSPASAIGVFAVGSQGNSSSTTLSQARSDPACNSSSEGYPGNGRSIVDILAYSSRSRSTLPNNVYLSNGCTTSYAAPAAAGAAIDFADHYFMTFGSVLDDPGLLHAAMLLMGDRTAEDGTSLTTGYDHLHGAGKLRIRRFDDTGMDAPWGFELGSVCVDDGQTITIQLNGGNPLPGAVDRIKAIVHWYDRRHEDGVEIDDMDLELRRSGAGLVVADTNDVDEKRRVFADTVYTDSYQLRIIGDDVTADDAGCGTNSMLVFYAYFYEDSARDDANGPGNEILVE
jgi:hypothetical protein